MPNDKFIGGHCVLRSIKRIYKPPPDDIIMHHATGQLGIEKKIKQLDYVRNYINNKNN